MSILQIILIVVACLGTSVAIGFFVVFIVETAKKESSISGFSFDENNQSEYKGIDIDAMLAKLEENQNESQTKVVVPDVNVNIAVKNIEPAISSKKEEAVSENTKIENADTKTEANDDEESDEFDIDALLAKLDEYKKAQDDVDLTENNEEEQKSEESDNENAVSTAESKEVKEVSEETKAEAYEEKKEEIQEKPTVIIKKIVKEGPEFDYRIRVEKIKESEEKLEKDLEKTEKAILKYERTERRLARNQKLLDRKAGELANLNLLMYNITDIKNVDEDKKKKQEDLVALISELKASIEDAEKYLKNYENKHANNLKLRDYLKSEQIRYNEELNELEVLIAEAEHRDPVLKEVKDFKNDDDDSDDSDEE